MPIIANASPKETTMAWRSRLAIRFAAKTTAVALTILAAGCGGSASNPGAPSSLGSTNSPTATGATISGQVRGASGAALTSVRTGQASLKAAPLSVSVLGTNIGTTTNAEGQFTLSGVPSGTVQLQFTGAGVSASVTLSGITATDEITIVVTVSGSSAHVDSDNRHGPPPAGAPGTGTPGTGTPGTETPGTGTPGSDNPNRVSVNGRIESVNVAARTFVADGTTVSVPPTAIIRHGSRDLAFADLTVGAHVQVKGSWSGTLFVATEVKVEQLAPTAPAPTDEGEDDGEDEDEAEDTSDDDHGSVRLRGAVSGRTGTCPAISFSVQGTTVRTDGDTRFRRVTCAALAAGAVVDVRGTRQSNGSVLARSVERED